MADLRPADDASIPGNERLYLRIPARGDAVIPVEGGGHRPHTGSVKPPDMDEPKSCDLASLCAGPEETRDRGTDGNFHVAELSVEAVRALGFRVVRDPIVEGPDQNPAHVLILGSRPKLNGDLAGALTNKEYTKLARIARYVIITPQPPGAEEG